MQKKKKTKRNKNSNIDEKNSRKINVEKSI